MDHPHIWSHRSIRAKFLSTLAAIAVEEYLGGGMADVYRARDTELPRDVAIKILKLSNQDDPEVRACFLDEVQLASRCSHENIVSTYDKGEFEGSPFIVMEFLRGERLDKLIHNQ